MNQFSFKDNSAYKYFSMIPHIITEIGLKGNEIAVYVAIKRSAGETSVCTKSKSKLAKQAGVCPKTIFTIINKLCEKNKVLKKPLIICHHRTTQHGDKDTNLIEIVDIWPEATTLFCEIISGEVNFTPPQVTVTQQVGYPLPEGQVNFTHKEQPIKKNPKEQQQAAAVFFDCLIKDSRLNDDNRNALMKFSEYRVKLAIEFSHHVEPTKGLIQQLIWHCKQKIPPELPKKSFWDAVRENFKNNYEYNNALCFINTEGISLERGMTHREVKFKEPKAQEKFEKIVASFGIKWKYG